MDLRVGGTYHYGHEAADGPAMWGRFVYREIVPPREAGAHQFVLRRGWRRHAPSDGADLAAGNAVGVHVRGAAGGKTRFTIRWSPHNATEEERKTFDASHDSMRQGWGGTMEQLEAYLKTARSRRAASPS